MRSEIERFHIVLSNINQKLLTRHVIVTCLNGKRKKKFSEEKRPDRLLLSGIKSDGFRFLQYIRLLWEEKALSYSELSYKSVTYTTTESCLAAILKGRQ